VLLPLIAPESLREVPPPYTHCASFEIVPSTDSAGLDAVEPIDVMGSPVLREYLHAKGLSGGAYADRFLFASGHLPTRCRPPSA
jgi:hypothetical protein